MVKLAFEKVVRIEEIMTPGVVTLPPEMKLTEAAALLAEARVTGAPVVTPNGRLLGMLSRSDLVDPRHSLADASVEDAMTRMLYAVRPTDPVMSAVKLMVVEGIHRVAVVNDAGALVGMVTSMDIMRALLSEKEERVSIEYRDVART